MKLGKAFNLSERLADYFRAKARTSHAQQQHVGEARVSYFSREICEATNGLLLFAGDVQSAQPFILVRVRPDRGVLLPKPSNFVVLVPIVESFFDIGHQLARQGQILLIDFGIDDDLLQVRAQLPNAR